MGFGVHIISGRRNGLMAASFQALSPRRALGCSKLVCSLESAGGGVRGASSYAVNNQLPGARTIRCPSLGNRTSTLQTCQLIKFARNRPSSFLPSFQPLCTEASACLFRGLNVCSSEPRSLFKCSLNLSAVALFTHHWRRAERIRGP